ncbi:hypothetical protein [Herminiimonas arsenitoxidans]|uniref:hypothetical protein n=1 Tax=Herminiimonas arsenitoxidans TaxID=1809410 RepID=UPI001E5C32F2|nr:hypothetical protein [Herminiimonas arsenitoxidans]
MSLVLLTFHVDASIQPLKIGLEILMKTDWNLVREMMAVAIDSCEEFEKSGYAETYRELTVPINDFEISLQEIMVSACTYPELLRYQIIRERHDKQLDIPYIPEQARILMGMAAACAELIGAADARVAETQIKNMIDWYSDIAVPNVQRAINAAA